MSARCPSIHLLRLLASVAVALVVGCAPPPERSEAPDAVGGREVPPPDGPFRLHVLRRCGDLLDHAPTSAEQRVLDDAWDLFSHGEGGDAVELLEERLTLVPSPGGLLLLTLGQLYVLAGQGVPTVVPDVGPAGDTGEWERNRVRFLARAEEVLSTYRRRRPGDAAAAYLMADLQRASGDLAAAAAWVDTAHGLCSLPASLDVLARHQELVRTPPRQLTGVAPAWPPGVTTGGDVVLDLLVAPDGALRQIETVRRPGPRLGEAAREAFGEARFAPARVGKYEVWAWLRVTVRFTASHRY